MKTKIFLILITLFISSSYLIAQNMDKHSEHMKTKIMNAYETFNSYNFDKLDDFIDVNYVEHSPDPGQKQGLAGLKEAFMNLKKGYPDFKITVDDIIISGDKAAVLFTFTGTNTGDLFGMKATNKSVSVQGIDYLYFINGKATEHWGYMDMHKLMTQLGMSTDN